MYVVAFGLLACVVVAALPGPRAAVGGMLFYLIALRSTQHRLPFRQSDFEEVVAQVRGRKLRPDSAGVVTLPPRWAHLTQDGKVYVAPGPDGNMLVTFVTWRGRAFNFEGYLHSRKPLRGEALTRDSFTSGRGFLGYLEIRAPGSSYPPDYPPGAPPIDPTEELSATVERRIEDNWYFISYRLD